MDPAALRMQVLGTDGLAKPVVVGDPAALSAPEPRAVVYVVADPAARRAARRVALRLGLRPAGAFLHLPDVERSAAIAALDGAAAFLLGGMLERGGAKRRLVHALLRMPGGAAAAERVLPNVGLAFTADGTRAGAWLGEGSPLVTQSWRADAPVVVLLVRGGDVARVVKLHADAATLEPEVAALRSVAPGAAAAGAAVPELVSFEDGVLVQSGVRGRPAQLVLRAQPAALAATLAALAGWLDRWGRATRRDTAAGVRVAVHNDLTMANVLLGGTHALGVVDWGGAVPAGLPLGDFAYAAADAVSACDGHVDRVAAFRRAFLERTPEAELVLLHLRALAAGLSLAPADAEEAFRAAWEHHAANEAARGDEGDAFGQIAALAATTELFA